MLGVNVNDGENTAAHEFGHHLGLSDRYDEGVQVDGSYMNDVDKYSRGTDPIIDGRVTDPDYNPNTNLMAGPGTGANGQPVLTPAQIRIASSSSTEAKYQVNGGYINQISNGRAVDKTRYRKIGPLIITRFSSRTGSRRPAKKAISDIYK